MTAIKIKRTPFTEEQKKEHQKKRNEMRKRFRASQPKLSPEQKAEAKIQAQYRKEDRDREREEKLRIKQEKALKKRELILLQFMKKTDVLYHHHGQKDSLRSSIQQHIDYIKAGAKHVEYDPYIWNYYGEGKNYMSRALLGCLWMHNEFETIYDVPLDGTYKFHTYDSGQRGSGSFNGITCTKVEEEVIVPKVSPGSIIPITAF